MLEAEKILIQEDWVCAPVMYYMIEYAVDPALKDWRYNPSGVNFFHTAYLEQ
jgi:hypothetical protein